MRTFLAVLFLCFLQEKSLRAEDRPDPSFEIPPDHTLVWENAGTTENYKRLACRKGNLLDGPCEEWIRREEKWQMHQSGRHATGKKHGDWKEFFPNTHKVRKTTTYDAGRKVRIAKRAEDGTIRSDTLFYAGSSLFLFRYYGESGKLNEIGFGKPGWNLGPHVRWGDEGGIGAIDWFPTGEAGRVGKLAIKFHGNGELSQIGWQIDVELKAIHYAGPRLVFSPHGSLLRAELFSMNGVLLAMHTFAADGEVERSLVKVARDEGELDLPEPLVGNLDKVGELVDAAYRKPAYVLTNRNVERAVSYVEEISLRSDLIKAIGELRKAQR